MANIELISEINRDDYTEYVCDQYDIQNRDIVITKIPMINTSELNDFNILLVLGNSGSGKSTILKNMGYSNDNLNIDENKSVISQFPHISPEDVCELFYGIGLASVPTWLKKPHELSNGEFARFEIAAKIANAKDGGVIYLDEYTSVVNRQCAKSLSFSLQRYIRKHNLKFVIASCHYDIVEWLQPDYVFDLNLQDNGTCELQKFVYDETTDYKEYKMLNDKDILSDARDIN